MRFEIDQRFTAPLATVLAAYTDRELYEGLAPSAHVARPDVLAISRDGAVVLVRLRQRFTADLPAAARAVLDPDRLTWVEESRFDLERATSTTTLVPDHYRDRLSASAAARFTADPADPGRSRRHIAGEVTVRGVPLVGGRVERAIVDGLREHLAGEARAVQRHLEATSR